MEKFFKERDRFQICLLICGVVLYGIRKYINYNFLHFRENFLHSGFDGTLRIVPGAFTIHSAHVNLKIKMHA